jgi:hypothetical protein
MTLTVLASSFMGRERAHIPEAVFRIAGYNDVAAD